MTNLLRAQHSGRAATGQATQRLTRIFKAGVVAVLVALAAVPAHATDWPTRPVTVIVPFAAGGFSDVLARIASKHLSEKFGQPVVVENRPGAGGVIGAAFVAAAAPDGYTILFGSSSMLGTSPLISKVSYDRDSFAPVAIFGTIPFLMGIKASLPAKNVTEFVAYAKANNGKLNYGTSGNGGTSHLLGAGFAARAGIDLVLVPFKGSAPLTAALVQGTVDMAWTGVPDMAAQLTNPSIRVVAISSAQRLASLPDIPSIAEFFPGFSLDTWNGFLAPRGTPKEIVDKIAQGVMEAAKAPEISKRLIDLGMTPDTSTPEQMADIIKAEAALYPDLLKAAGLIP